MRCLYCGKELALLKRLTGGGEFCSDAHKHSYQEEYNRLGLSRLLQARTRAGESKAAQKSPPAPAAPVAVAEPAVEEIVVEKVARVPQPEPPPVMAAPPEPPPPAVAAFVMGKPSILVPPQPTSHLEPWISDDTPPPPPAWHLQGPSVERRIFALSSAGLVPLQLLPDLCQGSHSVLETSVAPNEVSQPRVNLSLPLRVTSSHEFQPGGSVAIQIAPRPAESSCYASLNGAVEFTNPVGVQVFSVLDLPTAGIAYPAEDCDVTVLQSWTNGVISETPVDIEVPVNIEVPVDIEVRVDIEAPVDITVPAIPQDAPDLELPDQPAVVATPEATPRAALQALSRLHQDMREREEAKPAASPKVAPADVAPAEAPPKATEEATEAGSKATAQPAEPTPPEPLPREASELLAISLKSFAPPKAGPVVDATALITNGNPLLPRLKALPLRPKVAPAPRGFGQQVQTAPAQNPPVVEKAKTQQRSAPRTAEATPKPPLANKPAQPAQAPKAPQPVQTLKSAPTVDASKPAEPAQAKKQPAETAPAKPAAPAAPSQSAQPKAAKPSTPEQFTKPVSVKSVPAAPKTPPVQPPRSEPATATLSSPAKGEPVQKAPVDTVQPAAKAAAAASKPASPAIAESANDAVPNFGAVVNTSMFGSLKVKIGIAALAVVISVGAYFGFAGKSSRPSVTPSKSSDGAGMSIMVGEGGWVEGWAGDPVGLHAGRQITIYRPSLKLTDYRFDFQGQIETKSLGWIFRASDPENYYAMKLQLISPELPLRVELYKYLVQKGRQVQVGRVPIEVPVKNDTVFSIRVDVRGPKFNTYVQGQPVDVWTDDQLRSGGVGFLNERSERGKVKAVSLSYLSGGTK